MPIFSVYGFHRLTLLSRPKRRTHFHFGSFGIHPENVAIIPSIIDFFQELVPAISTVAGLIPERLSLIAAISVLTLEIISPISGTSGSFRKLY